jgi:two-component system osmolarity sensor histidine kinase EnvZ
MDYARPNETQLRETRLTDVVEREVQGFRDPDQIRFRVQVSEALKVLVDETELGRVLLNLFENARRYGHEPGEPARVDVSATRQGSWVELRVRDHGPGVPPDRLQRLTVPFYRGDAARTAASGAGLGLAIVEKSVQRLGGTLSISNADGGSGLITVLKLQAA